MSAGTRKCLSLLTASLVLVAVLLPLAYRASLSAAPFTGQPLPRLGVPTTADADGDALPDAALLTAVLALRLPGARALVVAAPNPRPQGRCLTPPRQPPR
jgi:O-antigen ligase